MYQEKGDMGINKDQIWTVGGKAKKNRENDCCEPKREAMCYRGKDLCRNCFREVATFERHQGRKDENREWWGNQERKKHRK